MPFPYRETHRLSPNISVGVINECRGVVLHHSVLPFDETVTRMLNPESQVSYHVLIRLDGVRCRLAHDESIAWHAGASSFRGRSRCNDFMLGLAFEGDTYVTPLSHAQLHSAMEWLGERMMRYRWTLEDITDHRQVSPGRKNDLNPIEWARISEALLRERF